MAHSDALAVIYELLSIYFISVMTIAVSVILQTNKQTNKQSLGIKNKTSPAIAIYKLHMCMQCIFQRRCARFSSQ